MTALMPRFFGDLSDWFETDFPMRGGHLIRVEDLITEREYVLRAELPGMDPEKDIQISVANGVLTVHAERKDETQTRHRSEFRYGLLQRSVRLPANADEENVSAKYRSGVLEITVPLKATAKAGRQIAIEKAS